MLRPPLTYPGQTERNGKFNTISIAGVSKENKRKRLRRVPVRRVSARIHGLFD